MSFFLAIAEKERSIDRTIYTIISSLSLCVCLSERRHSDKGRIGRKEKKRRRRRTFAEKKKEDEKHVSYYCMGTTPCKVCDHDWDRLALGKCQLDVYTLIYK